MRPISPFVASWFPHRSAAPKPAMPSWLAPRPAAVAQASHPAPVVASVPPSPPSAFPVVSPPMILEAEEEAPVIIPRSSSVPKDLLEHESLREENAALREENAALAARLDEAAQAVGPLRAQALRDSEPEVVRLALAVAERVVGRALAADPTLFAAWAREAVEALLVREGLTVTVSPDVAEAVPPEAWGRSLAAPHALIVDAALAARSCGVRAGAAAADAGPDARLAAVRDALAGDDP